MDEIPSYCITLEGDGSRWALFRQRARGLVGLRVARFRATDCRAQRYQRYAVLIEPAALRALDATQRSGERERHCQLTPGAVGCYLSHLAVLRHAYAAAQPLALVFEDDAVPPPNLRELLQLQLAQLEALSASWDMLVLGYLSPQRPLLPEPMRLRSFYRLHAYVVSARGMAKVLALGLPLRQQLDSALSDWSDRIEIYGAVPQLVANDDSLPTTIQLPVAPQQTPPPHRAKAPAKAPTKAPPKAFAKASPKAFAKAPRASLLPK